MGGGVIAKVKWAGGRGKKGPKRNPGGKDLPGFWKLDPSATGKALPAFPRRGRLTLVVVVMVTNHGWRAV
jgi:hypothetical protein